MAKKVNAKDDMMAGAFAGAAARAITAPFDLLKIRFQLQFADKVKYTSLPQAFSTIIREEGFFSLWKGNLSATYLWIFYGVIQFATYGFLKESLATFPDPFIGRRTSHPVTVGTGTAATALKLPSNNDPPYASSSRLWKAMVLFLAGAGAGIAATAATYPFDLMRTQFTIQGNTQVFTSMQSFISHTFKNKGIAGFYAGLGPAVVGITPYIGLNFALYETMKSFFEPVELAGASAKIGTSSTTGSPKSSSQNKNNNAAAPGSLLSKVLKNGMCGAVAGGTSKFLVYPLDTLKKRMQVQGLQSTLEGLGNTPRYSSTWNCIAKTYAEEGLKGFYKGIVPTVAKSVVATAVTFAAYETAKDFLVTRRLESEEKKERNAAEISSLATIGGVKK